MGGQRFTSGMGSGTQAMPGPNGARVAHGGETGVLRAPPIGSGQAGRGRSIGSVPLRTAYPRDVGMCETPAMTCGRSGFTWGNRVGAWHVPVLCAVLSVAGCEDDGVTGDGTEALASLAGDGDYIVYSLEESFDESVSVVRGQFVGAAMGRTLLSDPDVQLPSSIDTVVAEFEPDRVWVGDTEGRVYVELLVLSPPRRDLASVEYARALAGLDTIVFLREAEDQPHMANEGAGHPAGTTLHTPLNPESLIWERDGMLEPPLACCGWTPLFPDANTIEEASRQLDQLE